MPLGIINQSTERTINFTSPVNQTVDTPTYYYPNPPNITYAGSQPLFTPFGGTSGDASQWATFQAVANIDADNNNLDNVSIGTINTLNTNLAFINTLSTNIINLDGNLLTSGASGSNAELLLNGVPIATVSSITAIEDWSLYPAIQAINVANFDLSNVTTINGQPYVNGGGGNTWSGFPATQTVNMDTNSLNKVSGINLNTAGDANIAILTAGAGGTLNVNGVPVTTGGSAVNTWANFPATNTVTLPNQDLVMNTTTPGTAYNTANLNANIIIGNTTQAPLRPDLTAYCGSVQLGGVASPLTAMNVNSVGGINLTSLTGVAISGGGGVSVSGAGGVSILGAGGVALNGGNVEIAGAGGVLVNGTGAIVVTAGGVAVNGGGVAISAGGCAITAGGLSVAGGTVTIGTAGVAGGDLTVYGGNLNMSAVGGSTSAIITNKIQSATPNSLALTGVSTINGLPYSYNVVRQATYYKSVAQTLTSGNTDVTYDLEGSWNDTGGYITHTPGSTNFVVVQAGLYKLEFNALILLNGGTWTTTTNKTCNIDITRIGIAEQAVIINSCLVAPQNYGASVSGTVFLQAGDIINLRIGNTFTFVGTAPTLQQVQNTFDLNTFFNWTFITP